MDDPKRARIVPDLDPAGSGTAVSIRAYMGLGLKKGDDLRKAMTFKKMIYM